MSPFSPDLSLAFHTHLDKCQHCREHPLDLCVEGANVLLKAATGRVESKTVQEMEHEIDELLNLVTRPHTYRHPKDRQHPDCTACKARSRLKDLAVAGLGREIHPPYWE